MDPGPASGFGLRSVGGAGSRGPGRRAPGDGGRRHRVVRFLRPGASVLGLGDWSGPQSVGLYLRKRRRDRHYFDDQLVAQLADAFTQVASQQGALGHLTDCVQGLDGRARQICDLRYRGDHKPAAIAQQLGMSANTVAKTLQRIRDRLRDCIERKAAAEGAVP